MAQARDSTETMQDAKGGERGSGGQEKPDDPHANITLSRTAVRLSGRGSLGESQRVKMSWGSLITENPVGEMKEGMELATSDAPDRSETQRGVKGVKGEARCWANSARVVRGPSQTMQARERGSQRAKPVSDGCCIKRCMYNVQGPLVT